MFPLLLLISCGPPAAEPPVDAPLDETARAAVVDGYHVASSADQTGPFTNRLLGEHSPYLLQHAHNPVDWRPWGEAALSEASRRDVPIFLSIGYAACHWCHVMEEESFEDPVVAAFLNEHFVCVKVDREERPDVDALYMDAVVGFTGAGGWPASLWLTPDGRPFHAGTYFPPTPSHGRPGFSDLLHELDMVWQTDRARIESIAGEVARGLAASAVITPSAEMPQAAAVGAAITALKKGWDPVNQGWGRKKFPMPARLELMLAYGAARPDDPEAQEVMALLVAGLDAMDRGGIHDHLGGGFHRYTVDEGWKIPHFEKMLYDNGQLLRLYAEAAAVTDSPRFAAVARDIATYLLRDLRDPTSGALWSSQDADSAGEEGAYYLWTPAGIRAALPADQAELLLAAYGVTEAGNFEGRRTVLVRRDGDPQDPALKRAREALRAHRTTREPPPTDTKRVVAYNGLAISGLARGGRLLDEPTWVEAAAVAARAILAVRRADGSLPRTLEPGSPDGVVDDYAFFAEGLLDLFEADGDPAWLQAADQVAAAMVSRHEDPEDGGFFLSADPKLLVRTKELGDGAVPSGAARGAVVLARLRAYGAPAGDPIAVSRTLKAAGALLDEHPASVPTLALLLDGRQRPSMEVVLVAPTGQAAALAPFHGPFDATWRPHAVLAAFTEERGDDLADFTAFSGKVAGDGTVRAYVCFDGVCHRPTDDPAVYAELIARGPSGAVP